MHTTPNTHTNTRPVLRVRTPPRRYGGRGAHTDVRARLLPHARIARLIDGPVPIALIAFQGLVTIALAGGGGRGHIHQLFLTVVLVENVGALLLRNRHPLLALSGLALTYTIVDYPPTTLPALLLALLSVLVLGDKRASRLAVVIAVLAFVATPVIHGDLAGIGL